ncbi:MAG TPA: hypothetical protein VM490_26920 [Armatimonadaceae bacterium]|nr:hypothetical protein [Armatimonadaceae bacterium]
MEISTLADLRPRTVWEIVDDAFDLYRERFALFASLAAMVYVPAFVAYNVFMASQYGELLTALRTPSTDPFALFGWYFRGLSLAVPLLGIAFLFNIATTTVAVQDILAGDPVSLKSAFRQAFRRFFALLGVAFIAAIACTLGLCGAYIGAFFVLPLFVYTPQALLIEGKGVLGAERRSRDLASSNYGKTAGMLTLLTCVGMLLSLGFQAIVSSAFLAVPSTGSDVYAREVQQITVNLISNSVITLLLAPLPGIAFTLLYYDLRVRREGLDVEAEARRKDVPLAPDPFGGVLNPRTPRRRG